MANFVFSYCVMHDIEVTLRSARSARSAFTLVILTIVHSISRIKTGFGPVSMQLRFVPSSMVSVHTTISVTHMPLLFILKVFFNILHE